MFDKKLRFKRGIKLYIIFLLFFFAIVLMLIHYFFSTPKFYETRLFYALLFCIVLALVPLITSISDFNKYCRKVKFVEEKIIICTCLGKPIYEIYKKDISNIKIIELLFPVSTSVKEVNECMAICITQNNADPPNESVMYEDNYKDKNHVYIQICAETKEIISKEFNFDINTYFQSENHSKSICDVGSKNNTDKAAGHLFHKNAESPVCVIENKSSHEKGSTEYTRMIYMFDKEIRIERGWGGLILVISFWLMLIIFSILYCFQITNLYTIMDIYAFLIIALLWASGNIFLTVNVIKLLNTHCRKIYFSEDSIKICGYRGNPIEVISKSVITDITIIKLVFIGPGAFFPEYDAMCLSLNGVSPLYSRAVHLKYNKNRNYIFIQVREEIKDIILDELGIDISEYIPNDKKRHSCKKSQKP